MRIVLVAYFYAPLENVGALRWTRYVEYLRSQGNEVEIITGPWKSKAGANHDSRVHFTADPFSEDAKTLGTVEASVAPSSNRFRSLFKKYSPAFLLIDGKWIWSGKAFRALRTLIKNKKTDLVIVTGTPWSSLPTTALACWLSRIPYAIDFRDLWATTRYLPFNSPFARFYFSLLEKLVARKAHLLITVNDPIKRYLEKLNSRVPVLAMQNGFQGPLSWSSDTFNSVSQTDKNILYAGSISEYHGIDLFFNAAAPVLESSSAPHLTFMGRDYIDALAQHKVERIAHMEPQKADKIIARAGVLLITLNTDATEFTTGKLLTYISMGRPILYFGPVNSPAAEMISQYQIGWVVDCTKPERLPAVLNEITNHFKTGESFKFSPDREGLKGYSIESFGARLNACLVQATAAK